MSERTIKYVYDQLNGCLIPAGHLLDTGDEAYHQQRSSIERDHQFGTDRYLCPKCKGAIRPSLRGGRFFSHYSPVDPDCEWYTGDPKNIRDINREIFKFFGESPLHKRLKKLIFDALSADNRITSVKGDLAFFVDPASKRKRKPDASGIFKGRDCVFELQLSRTYLKDIVGRGIHYKNLKRYIVWIFHGFEEFREFAAAKDIFFSNRKNALELDIEAENASCQQGRLILKAHWFGYAPCPSGEFVEEWHSALVDLDDLTWDDQGYQPYFVDPETHEYGHLRLAHGEWLGEFEKAWLNRESKSPKWNRDALKRAHERFSHILKHRSLPLFETFEADGVDRILDLFFALRIGHQHYGKESLQSALNSAFQHRPHFTDAIIAISHGYNRSAMLEYKRTPAIISRNITGDEYMNRIKQQRAFDPIFKFLFPESIPYFKNEYDLISGSTS